MVPQGSQGVRVPLGSQVSCFCCVVLFVKFMGIFGRDVCCPFGRDVPYPCLEDKILICECEESRLPLRSDSPLTSFQFCLRGRAGSFVFVSVCLLIVVSVFVLLWTEDVMGQMQKTPLSVMIDHFSDVTERAHNLSTDV